jgi:hypothetical protein
MNFIKTSHKFVTGDFHAAGARAVMPGNDEALSPAG